MNIKPDGEKTLHKVMRRLSYFGIFVKNQGIWFWFSLCWKWNMSLAFSYSIILVLMRCISEGIGKNHWQWVTLPLQWQLALFSRGIREVGGICWDLLAQGIVALDLTLVMSWPQLGNVTAAFSPAWNCRVMDAERQEHFKLFSERPFSAPSMLVFWVWFSKQTALCLE